MADPPPGQRPPDSLLGRAMSRLEMDPSSPLLSVRTRVPSGEPAQGLWRLRYASLRVKGLVVAQFPNAAIAIWMLSTLAAKLTSGVAESIALAVALVALTAWAYLELAEGVNWFRRLLGGAILIYVVVKLTGVLPA